MVARRDVAGKEGKQFGVPLEDGAFVAHVQGLLEEVQGALLAQAREFRDANIVDVASYEELKAAVAEGGRGVLGRWVGGLGRQERRDRKTGNKAALRSVLRLECLVPFPCCSPAPAGKWARGPWAGSDEQEKAVKEETQATLRCFPFEQPQHSGVCFLTGQPAAEVAIFAKSY